MSTQRRLIRSDFRFASFRLMIIITIGLVLNYMVAFSQRLAPYVPNWLRSTSQVIFVLAVLIHIAEAIYAYRKATAAKFAWFLQTLLFGFASLKLLNEQHRVKKNLYDD